GDCVIVGGAVGVPGDALDCAHTFVRRNVGEHDAADQIADGPHAAGGGAQMLVDHHAPALELHTCFLGAQPLGVRCAADREQHLVGVDGTTLGPGAPPPPQPVTHPHDPTPPAVA